MVPAGHAYVVDSGELWKADPVLAPGEVVEDEALHAGGLGGVDHDLLQMNGARAHHADDGVLARHRLRQRVDGVSHPDDGQPRRERRRRLQATYGGDIKAGGDESLGNGRAEVATGLE